MAWKLRMGMILALVPALAQAGDGTCYPPSQYRAPCASPPVHVYVPQYVPEGAPERGEGPPERGAYAAPPRGGESIGESNTIGIRGFQVRIPEMRFEFPTIQLPSLFRVRRGPRMELDREEAYYVENFREEYSIEAGRPEAVRHKSYERRERARPSESFPERTVPERDHRIPPCYEERMHRVRQLECELEMKLRQLDQYMQSVPPPAAPCPPGRGCSPTQTDPPSHYPVRPSELVPPPADVLPWHSRPAEPLPCPLAEGIQPTVYTVPRGSEPVFGRITPHQAPRHAQAGPQGEYGSKTHLNETEVRLQRLEALVAAMAQRQAAFAEPARSPLAPAGPARLEYSTIPDHLFDNPPQHDPRPPTPETIRIRVP